MLIAHAIPDCLFSCLCTALLHCLPLAQARNATRTKSIMISRARAREPCPHAVVLSFSSPKIIGGTVVLSSHVPVNDSSIGPSVDPWSACAGATGAAGGWCWREQRSESSESSRIIGVGGPWRTDQFIWAARRFHFLIAAMPHCIGCWRPQRIPHTLWWTRAWVA